MEQIKINEIALYLEKLIPVVNALEYKDLVDGIADLDTREAIEPLITGKIDDGNSQIKKVLVAILEFKRKVSGIGYFARELEGTPKKPFSIGTGGEG